MLPSSVAGGSGGIIDATKASTFVAQLNASSWIDAYQLIIRRNTVKNEIVYNTGIVPLENKFYPTNSSGAYIPFEIEVGASSAPLRYESVTVSGDCKTVFVRMNMSVKTELTNLATGITLSADSGVTWTGTTSNAITNAQIKGDTIKITFTNALQGKGNKIKIASTALLPYNSYFQTSPADYVTDVFSGVLEDSLTSIDPSSTTICAGSGFSATVTGNKPDYKISRNAVISIVASGGNTELSSRTQADNKISYTILESTIEFYVGTSVSAGAYSISYTDNALNGQTKIVRATINVVASTGISYTKAVLDETNHVVSFSMNVTIANAKATLEALANAILLSTNGGESFGGTTSNPIIAVGFTNTEKTYSKPAVYNMRVEFTNALTGNENIVKIPASCIKSGSVQNTEITSPVLKISDSSSDSDDSTTENTNTVVSNTIVNGYPDGYKWTLKIWNGYDAGDPESNCIESFESCFDAKDTPVVTVSGLSAVTSRAGAWTGTYSQGQNVPLRWSRWQLILENKVVYDTDSLYSNSNLAFNYDGLISGKSYTIKLTCMTQDGVETSAALDFSVNYAALDSNGVVRVFQQNDGAIKVECANIEYITGVPSSNDFSYLSNTPTDGHTSISTGSETTIEYQSTIDAEMSFGDGDTLIFRMHSLHDGELLSWVSDDGSLSFTLSHEGLGDGLLPSTGLYPSNSLYPSPTLYGDFILTINGTVVSTIPSPNYGDKWYTICIKTTGMTIS